MSDPQKKVTRRGAKAPARHIAIMAGGRGERFWPVSREATPKQLITLLGGRSFLQQAVDRVRKLAPPANIWVITNQAQAASVRRQLPELPASNVVAEPVGRDTCAAVALAAAVVHAKAPDAVLAVLPADHVIPDARAFQRVLADSMILAASAPTIVTIGIKPTAPETGYGYIQAGAALPAVDGAGGTRFFKALRFVEKPNLETAQQYLAAGVYRWNAGMFVWSAPTILEALAKHQAGLHTLALRWSAAAAAGGRRLARTLSSDYPGLPKISVDYAILEKSDNIAMADGDFGWDDLGAWPALSRHLAPDASGNAARADFVGCDASGNVVFDARRRGRGVVALVGVNDSIVVLTDDATLVAARGAAQKIKDLVRQLAADPARRKLV